MTDIVYALDITLSDSIIGYLNGSSMICIATPYFTVPGVAKADPKKFLEFKTSNQYGVTLEYPEMYVKPLPTRPFTKNFMIAWAEGRSIKKTYYIRKLYETEALLSKFRHQLIVTPADATKDHVNDEDMKLVKLDNQLCMVMDALFIAKLFRIDLSTYSDLTDNVKFYVKLCTDVMSAINSHVDADSRITKDDFKISKDYIAMFSEPAIYIDRDKKSLPLKELGKPKTLIPTLWSKIYEICSSLDLHSKFKQWSILIKANSDAVPTFKFLDKLNESTNAHDKIYTSRIDFYQVLTEADKGYNPRVKPAFCTQRCIGPNKFEPLKPAQFVELWGATIDNPKASNRAAYSGCIFLKPQLDFKFYGQGTPSVSWKAVQLVLKRNLSGGAAVENADAAGFFEGEDDGQQYAVGNDVPC